VKYTAATMPGRVLRSRHRSYRSENPVYSPLAIASASICSHRKARVISRSTSRAIRDALSCKEARRVARSASDSAPVHWYWRKPRPSRSALTNPITTGRESKRVFTPYMSQLRASRAG
jgi:hypothetical protein